MVAIVAIADEDDDVEVGDNQRDAVRADRVGDLDERRDGRRSVGEREPREGEVGRAIPPLERDPEDREQIERGFLAEGFSGDVIYREGNQVEERIQEDGEDAAEREERVLHLGEAADPIERNNGEDEGEEEGAGDRVAETVAPLEDGERGDESDQNEERRGHGRKAQAERQSAARERPSFARARPTFVGGGFGSFKQFHAALFLLLTI